MAGLAVELFFQLRAHELAKIKDLGIGDEIESVQALFPSIHHPFDHEEAEVLGDIPLGETGLFDQSSDVLFSVLEGHEKAEPGRLAQELEAAGDELETLIGKSGGSAARHGMSCSRSILLYRDVVR